MKTKGKHEQHKKDLNKLNRISLNIGDIIALVIIVAMLA